MKSSEGQPNLELEISLLRQQKPELFLNPERRENEICLMNDSGDDDQYDSLPFSTKRKGKVPVDFVEGKPLDTPSHSGLSPVFVEIADYLANKDAFRKVQSELSGMPEADVRKTLDGHIEKN